MVAAMSHPIRNLADLQRRLGDVPLNRLRFRPAPGTATVADVDRIRETEGAICELIDGVLVEKAVGYSESTLAAYLIMVVGPYVLQHDLGFISGADGMVQLIPDLVRIPD